MTLTTTIEVDEIEIEVSADFTVYPGEPQTWDYPGCAPEIEFTEPFKDSDGNEWEPSEREWDRIIDEAHEYASGVEEDNKLERALSMRGW